MRKLVTGECDPENVFQLVDPTHFLESEFEAEVVKALNCLLPDYLCGVFSGAFVFEGDRRIADLALIHKSLSHWFVVEVELAGHSFEHHVLPQVRCFRYGDAEPSCVPNLVKAFSELNVTLAEQVLRYVPRFVAVVGNLPNPMWTSMLSAVDVQYLTVSVYRNQSGRSAHEVEGRLIARSESLGFGRYSATDNVLRIPKSCGLPIGKLQLVDQFGNIANWSVQEYSGVLWVQKERGPALIAHDSYVQFIRSTDGRISIRPSQQG